MVGRRQIHSRLSGAVMPRVGMIDAQTLSSALGGADVTIVAHGQNESGKCGSIHVGGPVIWHTNSALTLKAAGDVSVHDTIRATGKYASFTRDAGRPFLHPAAGKGNKQGDLMMTGAHASLRTIRPPVVPRLSDNPVASLRSSPTGTYSVAAPPARLAYSSISSRNSNRGRGSISQIGIDQGMLARPVANELLTEAPLSVRVAAKEKAQMGQPVMQQQDRRPDVQLSAAGAARAVASRLPGWWTRRDGTPVSTVASLSTVSIVPGHAQRKSHDEQANTQEQRTRAEALAFRANSPSESMMAPIEHLRFRISLPGEIDEEKAS